MSQSPDFRRPDFRLPDFRLEVHFQEWEFKARHHMTASDPQSMSLSELLAFASPEDRAGFENLWLGYTETYGAPDLRAAIAATYADREMEDILCFAGASEPIYVANRTLLGQDDHAIIVTPNYQSHEELPLSICEATGVPLDPDDGWSLDIDRVAAAIRDNTRLITINFPHNPTGAVLPPDRLNALVELTRKHGIWILSDEVYNGLGPPGVTPPPYIADLYERGLSVHVLSKNLGLPGLRIGWVACQDRAQLSRMERMKHYLSICNSAPSERLALIAVKAREQILARTNGVIAENIVKLEAFMARHSDRFAYARPGGSCTAFPKYLGSEGAKTFCGALLERHGVLLLPGAIYDSRLGPSVQDHFRIGFGREGIDEGLALMDAYLTRNAA
ncbi:MAG: aminotransferase class I/II-fold pyridoxal phosphate-dependent enzyme [Pseudomonadota bacterium]